MNKLIITVGITGSRITRQQTPYIPITPQEIAQSGIEAWRGGASVLHIHVRDPKTGLGTQELSLFKEVVDRIRSETDAILCLTTSGIPGRNLEFQERLVPLCLNPELVSFDAGTINMRENVFLNPPEFLELLAKETLAKGIKPELEVFEVEWLKPVSGIWRRASLNLRFTSNSFWASSAACLPRQSHCFIFRKLSPKALLGL